MASTIRWNFDPVSGYSVKYTLPGPWYVIGPGDRISCNVSSSPTSANYFSTYSNQRVGSNDLASRTSLKFDFYHNGNASEFSEFALYGARDSLISATSGSSIFPIYVRDDDATYANLPDRTTINLITIKSQDVLKINTSYTSSDMNTDIINYSFTQLTEIASTPGIYSFSISYTSDSIWVTVSFAGTEIFSKYIQIQDPSNIALFDKPIGSWLVGNYSGDWGSRYITNFTGYYDLTEEEQVNYHNNGVLTSTELFVPITFSEIDFQPPKVKTDYAIDISENVLSEGWIFDNIAIKQSVKNIVMTAFQARPFEEQFGTSLSRMMFKQISNDNGRVMMQELIAQIKKYEDRVTVIPGKCRIILDPTKNLMRLTIPFYINETGQPEALDQFLAF